MEMRHFQKKNTKLLSSCCYLFSTVLDHFPNPLNKANLDFPAELSESDAFVSSNCIRLQTLWYVFEQIFSSSIPCNSKSEYIF